MGVKRETKHEFCPEATFKCGEMGCIVIYKSDNCKLKVEISQGGAKPESFHPKEISLAVSFQ